MQIRLLLLSLSLALLTTGCGDISSSTGEFGRLSYSLHSDFLVDGSELVDVSILGGHAQQISVGLTSQGESDADNPQDIEHIASPADGVIIETVNSSDDVIRFAITVQDPGEYLIESMLDGQVFDRIRLTFDVPSSMALVTWIRVPNGLDFDEAIGSPISVDEGAQAAFVPIPLDATGERIAGDFVPEVTASPNWAVVTGINVLGIYEQNVFVARSPASVYFIEPGVISITIADTVNGVEGTAEFDVAPVEVPLIR